MTIAQTIITAEEYAKRDCPDAAYRLLDAAIARSKRGKDQARLYLAKMRIVDARIDAMVLRSQRV